MRVREQEREQERELEQEQENPEHNKLLSLSPAACRFSMYYIPHQVLPCM